MRIVALIQNYPPCIFLANFIHTQYPIEAAVVVNYASFREAWDVLKVKSRNPVMSLLWIADAFLKNIYKPSGRARISHYEKYFGNAWKRLNVPEVLTIKHTELHSAKAVDFIGSHKPDLIILGGMPIIRGKIIDLAGIACLNLHKGLLPYYRGTNCLFWPILEHQFGKIGVTIHRINRHIDQGDFAQSQTISIEKNDTLFSLEQKAWYSGALLMRQTIDRIARNALSWQAQDLTKGRTYYKRQFNIIKKIRCGLELKKYIHRIQNPVIP